MKQSKLRRKVLFALALKGCNLVTVWQELSLVEKRRRSITGKSVATSPARVLSTHSVALERIWLVVRGSDGDVHRRGLWHGQVVAGGRRALDASRGHATATDAPWCSRCESVACVRRVCLYESYILSLLSPTTNCDAVVAERKEHATTQSPNAEHLFILRRWAVLSRHNHRHTHQIISSSNHTTATTCNKNRWSSPSSSNSTSPIHRTTSCRFFHPGQLRHLHTTF